MCNIRHYLSHVYAMMTWIILPMAGFTFLPLHIVNIIYLATACAFAIICTWFAIETFLAWRMGSAIALSDKSSSEFKKITFIVPAYFDNEAVVLDETLTSYCNLKYNGQIQVMVVYNSKSDMSKEEAEFDRKWDGKTSGDRNNIKISTVKNLNSTSKAENVNYGLTLVDSNTHYIAIMDADHQPMPNNAEVAVDLMHKMGYDILQGACTIRNQDNFLSTMVSVEFEDMYTVGHQGRLAMFDLGIFGGSNGYWRASVLQDIKMDGPMLTEDIDSSIRATLSGYKIGYSSDVISSELAPLRNTTLRKQRLRWSQGWAEVSSKHFGRCIRSDKLSRRQKAGIFYLLALREVFTYVIFWPVMCIISHLLRAPLVFCCCLLWPWVSLFPSELVGLR